MKLEVKIGLFVFSGLVMLFLLSTQVGSFVRLGKTGYMVNAKISNALGIEKETKVKINGVEVGYVKAVILKGHKINLRLFIYDDVVIPEDSSIMLSQDNIFGGNFVNIILGYSTEPIRDEGYLLYERRNYSMQELMATVNETALEIKGFFGELHHGALGDFRRMAQRLGDAGEQVAILSQRLGGAADSLSSDLPETMSNIRAASGDLRTGMATINARLPAIVAQINDLTRDLNGSAAELRQRLPSILVKFEKLEDNLTVLAEDARRELNTTAKNANELLVEAKPVVGKVATFFDEGSHAVKKVNKYLDKMTQSELQLALRTGWQFKDQYASTTLSATYLPNPTRYYMFDVVSRDNYSRFVAGTKTPRIPEKHENPQTLLSLQAGKRYGDLLLRGGLIESTGGVGMDYFGLGDNLRLRSEIFDFSAQKDVRTTKPHARVTVDYRMLKHLHFFGGYDHFLDSTTANVVAGMGISFVDDDLKYLLGSSSSLIK